MVKREGENFQINPNQSEPFCESYSYHFGRSSWKCAFWFYLQVFGKSTMIGLVITFFAGLCFSLFSPAFNLATNDQWHTLKRGVPHLSVHTAFFYFSVSCFFVALVLNISFLYRPVLNLPKTTFKAYLNDWNGRGWALLAGLLCGFGNGLQFMGGQAAGYAAADAVQVNQSSKIQDDNAVFRENVCQKSFWTCQKNKWFNNVSGWLLLHSDIWWCPNHQNIWFFTSSLHWRLVSVKAKFLISRIMRSRTMRIAANFSCI